MTNLSQAELDAIAKLLDRVEELIKLDKLDEADRFLDEILKFKPDEPNVPFQRGSLLMKRGEHEKALEQFMDVYAKAPNFLGNLNNIAATNYVLKRYDDSITFYKKYLAIAPETDFILAALAICLYRHVDLDQSIKYFKEAIRVSPEMVDMHSNMLLAMIYAESVAPEELTEEAKRFGDNIARLYTEKTSFANERNKNRKLHLGYISPDFREHSIPYFVEPLLQHHNKDQFEIYAYSNTFMDNPIMERLKAHVDVWHDIRALKVEEAYDLIIEDKIDILVDLSGHTGNNNLRIFAGRAAPIQVTWLGYPATTGVKTMDYRITDAYAEPEGMTEHLSTETLWRLPHIFCVYNAHENSPPVIDHPPFEDNGYITFGCFNNFIKVRDPVLAAWSRILERVPDSRLLLEIDEIEDPKFLKKVHDRFKRCKIPLERVILEPRKKANQFVLYNKIDIALDPFPCVGGTTSMDTLWMGVPFITLAGEHFLSRMGVTILTNAGLPELIAHTTEHYIVLAADLARDRERLKEIRHNLRDRFAHSPAMNKESFARDMEEAYRGMWQKYCD